MKVDNRCQTCGLEGESILHVLFQCDPARQDWALSGNPRHVISFEEGSLASNLNYLLNLKTKDQGEGKSLRSWPWMIWNIWKSRNELIFKGMRWTPEEIVDKACKEADEWFLAQEVEEETQRVSEQEVRVVKRKWKPPPKDWVMCNVGFEWVKQSKMLGVAWVLRNDRGVVLMHNRRAFSNFISLGEARLVSILCAIEGMTSFHFNRVIFAGDFKDLFLAMQKPTLWPALRYQVAELQMHLKGIKEFQLLSVVKEENRGATIIAQALREKEKCSLMWPMVTFFGFSNFLSMKVGSSNGSYLIWELFVLFIWD